MKMDEKEKEKEKEDEKREEAIVLMSSNFNTNLTSAQLNKFHELHRRRLQIKAKSKMKTKEKGKPSNTSRPHSKSLDKQELAEEMSSKGNDSISKVYTTKEQEETEPGHSVSKKRQKLHWGLDTKERWERKANM